MSVPPVPSVLSVLVVDDQDRLRRAVAAFLDGEADLQVIASVGSGRAALGEVGRRCPDVIVLDQQMPDGSGLEVLPALRTACPAARIVMFSAEDQARDLALALGADEFLDKGQPLEHLAQALRSS